MISLVLFSLMLQCKVATRFGSSFSPGLCNSTATAGTRKLLNIEDDYNSEDETPPQNDYDYYRRQGDVPSPGVGH
ncbi:hypothetical protein Pint_06640 [Pistacia integerrima]|uniref:Uncharacterized protein n=1 Tax=Pistacia integerrima TaxID=434235 RepID=A0ACC0Z0D8_9ROSI|nr:hypothetical protein Pint_06640 [Pistacia integerrima]